LPSGAENPGAPYLAFETWASRREYSKTVIYFRIVILSEARSAKSKNLS
jgi:hypothetical protein